MCGRGLNRAATSALGHVTVALASAVPELDSTPINKLIDDIRSFVFRRRSPFRLLCFFCVFVCLFLSSFSTLILLVSLLTCKTVSQITYTVLVETFNPTRSHTLWFLCIFSCTLLLIRCKISLHKQISLGKKFR